MAEDTVEINNITTPSKNRISEKKEGRTKMLDRQINFSYRIQESSASSRILARDLGIWDRKSGGIIGVLFDNGKVAWSKDSPRHITLADQEEGKVTARLQTNETSFSSMPQINIHATSEEAAKQLFRFIIRSKPRPNTPVQVVLIDSLQNRIEMRNKCETLYSGKMSDFDVDKL